MPIKILMPALSPTMTEGNLAKWHKKEGDAVESGDVLAEIETDKATMEVEAVEEGILGKIVVPEGTADVAVNAVIALLLEDGEDASALDGADTSGGPSAPTAEPAKSAPATASAPTAPAAAPAASGDRVVASPLAKRIAAQEGLDLAAIAGSGPRGRIVKRDVDAALASGTGKAAPAAATVSSAGTASAPAQAPTPAQGDPVFANMPDFEAVPNSSMRKVIATRLTASARDIPHFNISIDVEIDKLLAARKDLNGRDGADYKISVNDFVIKAGETHLIAVVHAGTVDRRYLPAALNLAQETALSQNGISFINGTVPVA